MVSSAFENEYCTPPSNLAMFESGALHPSVVQESLKWNVGEAITIKFLHGEYEPIGFREKVKKYAEEWIVPGVTANLSYIWVPDGGNNADVRILYDTKGKGKSWSAVGTSCRGITDQTKPTMALGWNWGETEDECARHIRHEFGHTLGFKHEHQSPLAGFIYNKVALYAAFPNDTHVDTDSRFDAFNDPDIIALVYDETSVMHYQIQAGWITDPSKAVENPSLMLSEEDKSLARISYPANSSSLASSN
ncbi:hypothetical protein C8J56DRAFT_1165754 [Mycena floridula]|nr:hypothetical protein C8J56DRAFT_1165754 [Mycena floridula]